MTIPRKPDLIPITLPEEPGVPSGLARKFETTLLRFLLSVIDSVRYPIIELLELSLRFLFENTTQAIRPIVIPYLERVENVPGLPQETRDAIQELKSTEPVSLTAIGISLIIAAIGGVVMGSIQPIQRYVAQETDNLVKSARMGPGEAFSAFKRGVITRGRFEDSLKDLGWAEDLITAWEEILANRVSTQDLVQLWLREYLSDSAFHTELEKRGFNAEEIDKIEELSKRIPPVPDLIRMAVREAFTPDVISRFQLLAEFPGEFAAWAEKQGLGREWAERYWAAHWELPSLRMGFEMLHRGIITDEELRLLIKTHDVSPFWRDKLIQLSYSPYTRVDVRRMYASGILNAEDVYQAYRDIGYDHEKASNLRDFTVALSNQAERDLTKSEVLYGYREGFFNADEAGGILRDIGYEDFEVDYYLARVDYQRYQRLIKEEVKTVKILYESGQIEDSEVHTRLGRLNLPAEQINRYIRLWTITRNRKTKRPAVAALEKFRAAGTINDNQFLEEMSRAGYSEKYALWYLETLKKKLEE